MKKTIITLILSLATMATRADFAIDYCTQYSTGNMFLSCVERERNFITIGAALLNLYEKINPASSKVVNDYCIKQGLSMVTYANCMEDALIREYRK